MQYLFKKRSTHPLIQIHIAVFLWGFTAILGKLISIETLGLVFLRMLLASLGFFILIQIQKIPLGISKKQFFQLFGIGVIICVHWLFFYQSIKQINSSSIALICLGTGAMFVLWLEFIFRIKKKISLENIVISLTAILGMYFISKGNKSQPFFSEKIGNYEIAILYGIIASFLSAVFTIFNSKMTQDIKPPIIAWVEMTAGFVFLSFYLFIWGNFDFIHSISLSDSLNIILLSVFCTNIPFLLSIYSLKKLEPFIVTLSVNLEPIYGMIFAAILFREYQNFNSNFYIGSFWILFSVFLPIIFSQWKKRKN